MNHNNEDLWSLRDSKVGSVGELVLGMLGRCGRTLLNHYRLFETHSSIGKTTPTTYLASRLPVQVLQLQLELSQDTVTQ